VRRIIAITHRDCGAAAVAYGDRIKKDRSYETAMHREALRTFSNEVNKRYIDLRVELGIMDVNGAVEVVG
jgi:carbonic anhydrase